MTERRLIIGKHLLQRILEHCLEEKPYEACGIITGKEGQVLHAYATDNAKRSPVFYEVEAEQQEQVLVAMEMRGEELLGIYHSHPTAPAIPSLNDINLAVHYPEAIRLIVSLAGPAEVRAYLIQKGLAHDVMITILPNIAGEFHDLRQMDRRADA